MTREEIKKEADKLIDDCYTNPDYPKLIIFQRGKFLNALFPLMDKLGVVIKVELPDDVPGLCVCNLVEGRGYPNCMAGYEAAESLIKEE